MYYGSIEAIGAILGLIIAYLVMPVDDVGRNEISFNSDVDYDQTYNGQYGDNGLPEDEITTEDDPLI